MKQFLAGENDEGVRLSRFVARVTTGLPESSIHRHFRNKRIKVNGKRATASYRLSAGDQISLYINDEFFHGQPVVKEAHLGGQRQLPPPNVVWQDSRLAVLYKPAGVVSHPEKGGPPSLLDSLLHSMVQQGDYDPRAENQFAPALCNRLDRGTEGLVLAAKKYSALRDMNALIRDGMVTKTYLCITQGRRPPEGTHTAYLRRERGSHSVTVSASETAGAKPISTGVKVLETANGLSLCEIRLDTGRTHQIRAHLAFLGAPVAGDRKYGKGSHVLPALPSQALCAWRLSFAMELPKENTLQDLAGRVFTAEEAVLPGWWQRWKNMA